MRVFVVRHGESETNQRGLWTGWLDVPLTEKGKADAEKAGAFLRQISFDRIYTSDLTRAGETARIAIPGCQCKVTALLREINVGTLAGKPLSLLTEEQRAIASKEGYRMFDGESKDAFRDRISQFMETLEALDCENIAVFSHAGYLRCFLEAIIAAPLPMKNIRCGNCTVGIFEYENAKWSLHSWLNLL